MKFCRHVFCHLLCWQFNPVALRKAKTPQSFGLSECNRVKIFYCCNEVFSILLLELSAMLLFSVACSQYDA